MSTAKAPAAPSDRICEKILPSSQSAWNTRFYFGHQKLCMDNNHLYWMKKNILDNDNTLPNESLFKTRGNEKERTPLK